jgi:hypothetical protein
MRQNGIERFVTVHEGKGKMSVVLRVAPLDEGSIVAEISSFVQMVDVFKRYVVGK